MLFFFIIISGRSGGFGMFSMFKNLVGSKMLTREDLIPVLDKMKEHLTGENLKYSVVSVKCFNIGMDFY